MKPPRTLFSLGRPGAKPAASTLAPDVVETGSDTVVETVEAPPAPDAVETVETVETPTATGDAGAIDLTPDAEATEVVVIDEPAVADTVVEDAPGPDDAAVEPSVAETVVEPPAADEALAADDAPVVHETAETADVADVAAADEVIEITDPTGADAYDASAEESGYLCGACEAPLPVGATVCAACGTPVAGAELYEEPPAAAEESALAASAFVAGAAIDDRATLVPDAPAEPAPYEVPVAEVAPPAAVLYDDPSGFEPLPPAPEGSWGITEPSFGGVGDDLTDPVVDPATAETASAWADPGAAAAVGIAATAGMAAGIATAANQDESTIAVPAPSPAYAGSGAASMPYGTGAVTSSEKPASKAPIWIAAAVVVVLVGLVGGILIASGGKDEGNLSATQPTTTPSSKPAVTTAAPTTATTAASTTPTTATPTTAPSTEPTTATTAAPTSTDAPTTVATTASTVVATTQATVATTAPPRQTTIITSPPTTAPVITPGSISPSQPNGAQLRIPKGGRATITLTNTGGRPASCAISVGSGNLSLDRNCSPQISPGSTVTINITANPGFEGAGSISGLLEGVGPYTVPIFVQNG